jgi:hypothetical protein
VKVSRRVNVIGLEINWGYGYFPVMPAGIKSENNNSFARKSTRSRGDSTVTEQNYGEV